MTLKRSLTQHAVAEAAPGKQKNDSSTEDKSDEAVHKTSTNKVDETSGNLDQSNSEQGAVNTDIVHTESTAINEFEDKQNILDKKKDVNKQDINTVDLATAGTKERADKNSQHESDAMVVSSETADKNKTNRTLN